MNSAEHKLVGPAMDVASSGCSKRVAAMAKSCASFSLTTSTSGSSNVLGHSDIKTTQRYLNITDEELRKAMTGVWERRRQLRAVNH